MADHITTLRAALLALEEAQRASHNIGMYLHGVPQSIEPLRTTHAQPSEPKTEPVATTAADHVKGEIGYCTFHSAVPNETKLYAAPQTKPSPVTLKVVNGDICIKSLDMDQSYGMWIPVTYSTEHGFVEGTCFYTK